MIGTIVNVGTVIVGASVGIVARKVIPEKLNQRILQVIGLFTFILGTKLALNSNHLLIVLISLLSGTITGEILNIDQRLSNLSENIKKKIGSNNPRFTEGFLTSFLLFCMGPLTIVGALQDGLSGDPETLYTKAIMDGFTSIVLASALGYSVMFSSIPLFIYQALFTLLGMYLGNYVSDVVINEISAVGGIMIFAIGIQLLNIKRIPVANLLPSLVFVIILTYFFA
jgi:uncharacterized membrane protein YqgA involved in biofilm formation